MRANLFVVTVAAGLFVPNLSAVVHVTLECREAVAGSYHTVVFRVPHRCQGSPTVAVSVIASTYGRLLQVKPRLVGLPLADAAFNKLALTPRLRNWPLSRCGAT